MPTSLIRYPALEIAAGQYTTVRLDPFTPGTGRTLADYASFLLVVREDPEWPRSGATEAVRHRADPIADGWEVVASAEGVLDDDDVPTFGFDMPNAAGVDRYAYDVWATLVSGGQPVQVVQARWVTAGARVAVPE
jgi:hypothetical protein